MASAWVLLQTDDGRADEVATSVRQVEDVIYAAVVQGAYDVVVAVADDPERYDGEARRVATLAQRLAPVRRAVVCQAVRHPMDHSIDHSMDHSMDAADRQPVLAP